MGIGIGFILNIIIGDRVWLPNPVRLIDKLITWLKIYIRRFEQDEQKDRLASIFLAVAIIGIAYTAVWAIILITAQMSLILSIAVSSYFIYTELSIHSLGEKTKKIYEALQEGNRVLAGQRLSALVGRDIQDLNEEEIVRATVEAVAKNTVEGIIAPLFYIFIGGPALGMAYKAVNAHAYRDLGWVAAKLSEIVNWLPARLTGLMMPMAGAMCGKDGRRGYKIFNRDKNKHKSLNAGYPEAAMAGVLGIQLGGNLGDQVKKIELPDILDAARIMRMTAFLSLAVFYMFAMKFGNI